MKLFILFIILNLSSLTFVQAEGILQAPKFLQNHKILQAETSVWEIHSFYTQGSGFFISPKLFVTNFHILLGLLLNNEEDLNEIRLAQKGNPNILNIKQVVSVSILYDLAIIEIKETSQHYLNLSETELKTDEDLFVIGYSSGVFLIEKNTGKISYENDSLFMFPVSHSNLFGTSGGPILNEQGQLVGVLFGGGRNILNATKINHLKNLITGNIGQNCEAISSKNCLEKEIENLIYLVEQNYIPAQFQLAKIYYNLNRNVEAMQWLKKVAQQGHVQAQYDLGAMYFSEHQNYERAQHWFQQAAEQGYPKAQFFSYFSSYKRAKEGIKNMLGWN